MEPVVPQLPPGRSVKLPGRGTTFVRQLEGPRDAPTLVLLHGWTATADLNWFTCYYPLSRHFDVVALDQRGHGRGIRSTRPFRLETCADDVVALADELGIDQVVPVGYSMGGPVAQLVWRRHPERVKGLVLCATARSFARNAPGDRAFFSALTGLSAAARFAPDGVRRRLMTNLIGARLDRSPLGPWAASELRRNDPAALMQAGASIGSFRSTPWLGDVDVPTAVVVTTGDGVVAPARQLQLAEAIPGATVHRAACDHGAVVSRPDVFVPVLLEACDSVARRARRGLAASG